MMMMMTMMMGKPQEIVGYRPTTGSFFDGKWEQQHLAMLKTMGYPCQKWNKFNLQEILIYVRSGQTAVATLGTD